MVAGALLKSIARKSASEGTGKSLKKARRIVDKTKREAKEDLTDLGTPAGVGEDKALKGGQSLETTSKSRATVTGGKISQQQKEVQKQYNKTAKNVEKMEKKAKTLSERIEQFKKVKATKNMTKNLEKQLSDINERIQRNKNKLDEMSTKHFIQKKRGGVIMKKGGGGMSHIGLYPAEESRSGTMSEAKRKRYMKKGGKVGKKEQGYKDRKDESIAMRVKKPRTKKQLKASRDESYGKWGHGTGKGKINRKYGGKVISSKQHDGNTIVAGCYD